MEDIELQMKLVELEQQLASAKLQIVAIRTAARNALIDLESDDVDEVRKALQGIANGAEPPQQCDKEQEPSGCVAG